ncbi:hypothetical protein EDB89DRAFT_1911839 [Lactarius sanguifluus]|nr:hypothetical protein EDB89DRAFT_1911839 [Lactarius sanguifluus]
MAWGVMCGRNLALRIGEECVRIRLRRRMKRQWTQTRGAMRGMGAAVETVLSNVRRGPVDVTVDMHLLGHFGDNEVNHMMVLTASVQPTRCNLGATGISRVQKWLKNDVKKSGSVTPLRPLTTALELKGRSKVVQFEYSQLYNFTSALENQSKNGDTNAGSEPWSELTTDCGITSKTKLTASNDGENQPGPNCGKEPQPRQDMVEESTKLPDAKKPRLADD